MNPGTFYLYEYENNKRRRNVGFIKTARHYRSCILQIHAAGIPAGNGASLELYAFFLSGQDLIAEQIAVLNCFRRNISARLPLSETTFPEGRPLSQIDGFLICLPGNRHTLFWMASDLFFDVDISRMRIPSREQACADIRAAGAAELPVRSETLVRSPKLWSVLRQRFRLRLQTLLRRRHSPTHCDPPRCRRSLTARNLLVQRYSLTPRNLLRQRYTLTHRTDLPQKRSGVRTLPVSPGNSGRLQTTASCSTVTTIISC